MVGAVIESGRATDLVVDQLYVSTKKDFGLTFNL